MSILWLYGALLLFVFGLNAAAARDDYKHHVDAMFAAGMLCVVWAFTNLIAQVYDFPANKQFHPQVDLIALSACVVAYMTQPSRWKLVLGLLFLGQLSLHAWFWLALVGFVDRPTQLGRAYIFLLNLLWFGQLVCVATPGGTHVAHRALQHLRPHRGVPHLVRH